MPSLQIKDRTAEAYLAGLGASGALVASAFVLFVVLVGIVTFDAWPRASQLIGGQDGHVSLNTVPSSSVVTPPPKVPNLAKLLGGSGPVGTTQVTPQINSSSPPRSEGSLSPGTNTSPGPSPGGGQTPAQTPEPPPPSPVDQGSTVVRGAVSTVGNSVEGTTNVVGDVLGGNGGPGLGGLVGGLGRTVNSTVQGLVGNNQNNP